MISRKKSDKFKVWFWIWVLVSFLFIMEFHFAINDLENKFSDYEKEKATRNAVTVTVSLKEYEIQMNEFHQALQEMQDFVYEGEAK